MSTFYAALVALVAVVVYVWQDGFIESPDGQRYTSSKSQPYPFHRRFCGWPAWLLRTLTLASLVALGGLMGTWKGSLLFITLPGAWLVATRATTVDAPCMLLAYVASMLWPTHPFVAVLLSCASGFIHERGPVFAAIYAWHPLLLIGLVAMGWWRKAALPDADRRVGRGFIASLLVHHDDNDWLNWQTTAFALRGLPLLAAWLGMSTAGWAALGLAWATRLVATDLGRMTLWAAPVMIRDMPDVPAWAVMLHAVSFRRMG